MSSVISWEDKLCALVFFGGWSSSVGLKCVWFMSVAIKGIANLWVDYMSDASTS